MSRTIAYISRMPAPLRRLIKRFPGARKAQAKLAGAPIGPPPEPGQLRPVVYLPTWARWDEMRQRPQYLLAAFANAGHDVYFVDPREPAVRSADGVSIVPSLKFVPASHVILYVHFAPLAAMFDSFEDAVIVYDILDDLSIYDDDEIGMPENRRVRSHHRTVIARADLVMASAPELVSTHRGERSGILLVENGVEPKRFRHVHGVPKELKTVPKPIVGYHGAVARWFDFDLLRDAAQRLPDFQFVIVGPVDPDAEDRMADLNRLSNVHRLGAVPSDEIPEYVAAFDVGIVPFVVDDLTRAVSPLKMYEYLAANVPVVATPLPVCVAHPVVRTAASVDDFVSEIEAAAGDRGVEEFEVRARAAADEASWDSRVDLVRSQLLKQRQLSVPS
jgi:glycosyltransferase involved in cell wall biosynthesis